MAVATLKANAERIFWFRLNELRNKGKIPYDLQYKIKCRKIKGGRGNMVSYFCVNLSTGKEIRALGVVRGLRTVNDV